MSGSTASNVVFVAHQDDSILFMEQSLQAALERGEPVTTVFVTAGDAGRGAAYWLGREEGARAAMSQMTGSTQWVTETVTLGEGEHSFQVVTSYLADQPEVRLYFLRLPDGMLHGTGSGRYGRESLEQLVDGDLDRLHSVDGAASYDRAQLVELMRLIMDEHAATRVLVQDHVSVFSHADHSDHRATAWLAELAFQGSEPGRELVGHVDYGSRALPENVPAELLEHFRDIFRAYAAHDPLTQAGHSQEGQLIFDAHFEDWLQRDHLVADVLDIWALDFTQTRGGWRMQNHVRTLADVDGDGQADIVGFGNGRVMTALAGDYCFDEAQAWSEAFTNRSGWRLDRHEREMGDLNGDGRADIVAFGDNGVTVALSNGQGFVDAGLWLADMGQLAGNWRIARHERAVADIDGDGCDDVIGFGNGGVQVSLSTGSGLAAARVFSREFTWSAGWRNELHVRALADVDGDGRADIVAFGETGVQVALSTGSRFAASTVWSADFGRAGGWDVARHERMLADVDGDGRADIVAFGETGVQVALSTGTGFAAAVTWSDEFAFDDGWRTDRHERIMADINGDGRADIVGFGEEFVEVALSTGSGFAAPVLADDFAV